MKIFKQLMVISGLFALLANIPASAFDGAVLKGIEISSPDKHSYKIVVKADKDVPIKKYITDANKVVLELENIKPAQFVNTMYNNATEIDHVIVHPLSGNRLRIFLQGLNIAAGKIILDTRDESLNFIDNPEPVRPVIPAVPERKPEISTGSQPLYIDLSNKSVDKIKAVSPMVTYADMGRDNFQTVQKSMNSGVSMDKIFEAGIFDWVLRFVMLAVIIAGAVKFFTKPKNVEINLSTEKARANEIGLLKTAESRKELLTKSLGFPSRPSKPVNSSLSNYGLQEYRNSQLPPRKTATSAPKRPAMPQRPELNTNIAVKEAPKQPARTQTKVTRKQTEEVQNNFDGTRFLQTMAEIYQKSGRDDLASGIRQNLIKKQTV